MDSLLLRRLDELPDSSSRGFDPLRTGQDSVLVVRRGSQLFAYADVCPHHGTPMAWRKDAYLNAAGDRIVCAAHGAQFEVDTGRCTLGPCLGDGLTTVPLNIHPNGEVHIAERTTPQETHP